MARPAGRPSLAATVDKTAAVIRCINELASRAPWQTAEPVAMADIANALGLGVEEVVRIVDFIDLACGDVMPGICVELDARRQTLTPQQIDLPLSRPLRLTEFEANALLAALKTAGFPSHDPLVRGLRGALPQTPASEHDHTEPDMPAQVCQTRTPQARVISLVVSAIENHEVIELSYRGRGAHEVQLRAVEPARLSYDQRENAWYLHGWCRQADDWRTFRISRIDGARLTGETVAPREATAPRALDNVDLAPMAILAVHDPLALVDPDSWRGLVRIEYPQPMDRMRLSDEERKAGAYMAAIPWNPQSDWLATMIVQTLGGVEAVRPAALRQTVADTASKLLA